MNDNLKQSIDHLGKVKDDIEIAREKRIAGLREFIKMAEQAVEIEKLGLAWRFYDISNDEFVFRYKKDRWQAKNNDLSFDFNGFIVCVPFKLTDYSEMGSEIVDEIDNAQLRLVAEIIECEKQTNPFYPRNDESTNIPKEVKSMVVFKDVLHVATTDGVFAKDRDGKFQRIFTP